MEGVHYLAVMHDSCAEVEESAVVNYKIISAETQIYLNIHTNVERNINYANSNARAPIHSSAQVVSLNAIQSKKRLSLINSEL